MTEIECIGDENACSAWVNLAGSYLRRLGGVVEDVPKRVLLLVAGGGDVVTGDSGSRCVTCGYDVVIPVGGDVNDVSRRATVISCISTYYVKRALKGIASCSMPILEGVSFYLAYLMSRTLDGSVHDYFEKVLRSANADDALTVLREYGDLVVDSSYRVVLRSSNVNNVSEALRTVIGKSVKLKEDVRARAVMSKYVSSFFRDAGVHEEDPQAFREAVEAVARALKSLCAGDVG